MEQQRTQTPMIVTGLDALVEQCEKLAQQMVNPGGLSPSMTELVGALHARDQMLVNASEAVKYLGLMISENSKIWASETERLTAENDLLKAAASAQTVADVAAEILNGQSVSDEPTQMARSKRA